MKAKYVLTTYSPTMFGTASIHQRVISLDEAKAMITSDTLIVSTRDSHDKMAKHLFGEHLKSERFADMSPDSTAILIHYRGKPVGDDGKVPDEGIVTIYLIESEDYLVAEDD